MNRLSVLIFVLLFIAVGYIAYLSQLALEENRASRVQFQTLAVELAQNSSDKNGAPASDPLVVGVAFEKMGAVDKMLMTSQISNPSNYRVALALANRARMALGPRANAADGKIFEALIYILEAERLLGGDRVPVQTSVAKVAPPVQKASVRSAGRYRVSAGETLWVISKKLYKTPWHWNDILQANAKRIGNYKKIPAGFILNLPSPRSDWGACAKKI